MSTCTQVPGGQPAEDGAHEHSAAAPDHRRLLCAVSDFLHCLLTVTIIGIGYLHDSRWVRAFLALGLLYVVTSTFTLAKCIRDRQEEAAIVSRVDQARLDKLLAEQDLLRVQDH
jgi:hypothetical protein